MSFYETTFIVRHDLSRQEVDKLADQFSKIITDAKGKVTKTENWGLRGLAYKINKHSKGHYVHLCIDADYTAVAEMERQMRISDDVMRLLTVRVEKLDNKPSVMMQKPEEDREDAA